MHVVPSPVPLSAGTSQVEGDGHLLLQRCMMSRRVGRVTRVHEDSEQMQDGTNEGMWGVGQSVYRRARECRSRWPTRDELTRTDRWKNVGDTAR